jgi:hypothetical protein
MRPGSKLANVSVPILSSHTANRKEVSVSSQIPILCETASTCLLNGSMSCIHVLNALCSVSIVLATISGHSLLVQITGQSEMDSTNPVWLLTQDGSCLSSKGHSPAKSAST